jgi:predicted AAA+ superfamily ATPase
MNDNHSRDELKYKKRWIGGLLRSVVRESPVVVVTGARQVGKSTMLRYERPFSDWQYASLDDFDILEQAEKNPTSLWAGRRQIVLDEVQKAPKLLSAVKQAVDQRRSDLRFVLTGSVNLLLMHRVLNYISFRSFFVNIFSFTTSQREANINRLSRLTKEMLGAVDSLQ